MEAYQQAISLAPDNGDFYYALGYSLAQLGDDKGAIAAYEKATVVQPQKADNFVALGVLLVRNREYENVETYFQRAIALDPKNETAYDMMATALYQQEKKY